MVAVVDVAGASMGGAARFLLELDEYLGRRSDLDVTVIGRGRRLSPPWVLRREYLAARSDLRIALNNLSFVAPRARNITLLRNALHFASATELRTLWPAQPLTLRAETGLVRTCARRADVLVVPCRAMAERVTDHAPALRSRITVRPHPIRTPAWAGSPSDDKRAILVPIHPAPYKNLEDHLLVLLEATERIAGPPITLVVTASPGELPRVRERSRVSFIGRVNAGDLDRYWQRCQAVYFPTAFEAFGYPLAEAAAVGRYVIAQATDQNHEIAGAALCAYTLGNVDSIREAVEHALGGYPDPDLERFDPNRYFSWLFQGAA